MILTEKVEVKIIKSNIDYYINKGYKCNLKDIIKIDVNDLQQNSHMIIKVQCDICEKEKELKYQQYCNNYNNHKIYACSDCGKYKFKMTCLEKYGVENVFKLEDIKEKIKKTNLDKYGVDSVFKSEYIKEKIKYTNLEKYGVENVLLNTDIKNKMIKTNQEKYGSNAPTQNKDILKKREKTYLERYGYKTNLMCEETKEKIRKTNLERYGVENPSQSEDIKNKKIQSCLINYGVENPLQDEYIFNKVQKSGHKLKKYKDVTYRGTYELDFLKKFYDKVIIINAKSIQYIFDNKSKKYYPDFYLPDYNLIVEIKSSYTYECEKEQNEEKKKAAINNGYDFIFIINKNYNELFTKISF